MKIDILPDLVDVPFYDRNNNLVSLRLGRFDDNGINLFFLAEHNRHGHGAIAANSLVYVNQILQGFELSPEQCEFYRYIHTPASGPIIGRFDIRSSGGKALSYSVKMLTQVEVDAMVDALSEAETLSVAALAESSHKEASPVTSNKIESIGLSNEPGRPEFAVG